MSLTLLVDGDRHSRLRLAMLLTGVGLKVAEASDGGDALRVLSDQRPDAAVLDLASAAGGITLLRTLRAACQLPIIALTDDGDPAEVARALEAGADDVLPRTCERQELLVRLRAAVHRRGPHTAAPTRLVQISGLVMDRTRASLQAAVAL